MIKKLWKPLADSYFHPYSHLVFLMFLGMTVLPMLLKSLAMQINQAAISVWLVIVFDLSGSVAAILLFAASIRHMDGYPKNSHANGLWKTFYKTGIWLMAAYLLSDVIYDAYVSYGAYIAISGSPDWYVFGQLLIAIFVCFSLSTLVFWLLCVMADPEHGTSLRKAFGYWNLRPVLCLGTGFWALMLLYAVPLSYDFMLKNLPALSLSFLLRIGGAVVLSLMQWLILQPVLVELSQHAVLQQDSGTREKPGTPSVNRAVSAGWKKHLSFLTASAIIVSAGVYGLIGSYPVSTVRAVSQDIQSYLFYETEMARAGDYAAAESYRKIAEARLLAWQGAVLERQNTLGQAMAMAPSDEQVQLLSALKSENRLPVLEQGLLSGNHSDAWYHALLCEYGGMPVLTELQRLRKAELLRICILQGSFLQAAILPEDLSQWKDDLARELERLEQSLVNGKYYALLARMGEEGGITKPLVLDALALSESYPDQVNLQYLAMTYGCSYLEDKGEHYKRTADAALRYDSLYQKEKAKTASKETNITEKLTVAKALITCGELQACAVFLAESPYAGDELDMINATCLFSLKAYEKCLLATSGILARQPENPHALYLSAICALQLGKTPDSIQYAIRLAGLVETTENPLESERLLYPYLLRFTINDANAGYATEAYGKLDEEGMALLKSNDLLYNYATAAHLWTLNDAGSKTEALDCLNRVLSVKGGLSRAIYMKGALFSELQDDGQALENLKESVKLDDMQPTAWYALATLYDRTKQYDEAYAACQKVLDCLPSTDHASDVFGVSIHASQLMANLKQYVKAGD